MTENSSENTQGPMLTIEGCSFSLRNITFSLKQGELCAIIGSVGSGKSSILKTILEEMHLISGDLFLKGSIAYVEQEPWIMSGTVRENIVMEDGFDQHHYEQILESCCLTDDLNSMMNHDNSQTGIKGVNLSGGQRVRIALARAAYAQRDIYLLDEPFSSVDSKVADDLFKLCIDGFLKGKTRLMVTNHIEYLPYCDKIILLDQGKIAFQGSYEELKSED